MNLLIVLIQFFASVISLGYMFILDERQILRVVPIILFALLTLEFLRRLWMIDRDGKEAAADAARTAQRRRERDA